MKSKGRKAIDLTNMRFGKWTVIRRDFDKTKPGRTMWICKCDCGNEYSVIGAALRNGTSTKCNECNKKKDKREGDSYIPNVGCYYS